MTDISRLEAAEQETPPEWYRSPLALVAAMVLILGVLAVIVLSLTGGDDSADAPAAPIVFGGVDIPEVDTVTISGEQPLPPLPREGADPAIGMFAPDATATSLANGAPIILDGGRARVIGFFAHWCPHCQRELPEVTAWLQENELPPNTEFVAVSTDVRDDQGNYPPSAWFTEVGWPAPVVVDDANRTLLNAYGFSGFPAFIAIDATGTVVAREGGNIGIEGIERLVAAFAR